MNQPRRPEAPDRRSALEQICEHTGDQTATSLVAGIGMLIRSHRLPAGTKLPTVRELAAATNMSPSTIARVWDALEGAQLIETLGRRGTWVLGKPPPDAAHQVRAARGPGILHQLAVAAPTSELLPDLREVWEESELPAHLNMYPGNSLLPGLEERLRADLPGGDAMFLVNGGNDGLDVVFRGLVHRGDRVLIESPTNSRFHELIRRVGAHAITVESDDYGPTPESLEEGLAKYPSVALLQPRGQVPLGSVMTGQRSEELAEMLKRRSGTVVVEDDANFSLSRSEFLGINGHIPERSVLLRTFSKSHGPDLRIGYVAGPRKLIESIRTVKNMGSEWVSRISQTLLLTMLEKRKFEKVVEHASEIYQERRSALVCALRKEAVPVSGLEGLSMWTRVDNEEQTVLDLAASGIAVGPGRIFTGNCSRKQGIRIATLNLKTEDSPAIASAIAAAQ